MLNTPNYEAETSLKRQQTFLKRLQHPYKSHCSGQRSWVLPGLRGYSNQLGGMGAAGGVTQAETGAGPPRTEEGNNRDPVSMEEA
jgi:hypothetical protein